MTYTAATSIACCQNALPAMVGTRIAPATKRIPTMSCTRISGRMNLRLNEVFAVMSSTSFSNSSSMRSSKDSLWFEHQNNNHHSERSDYLQPAAELICDEH